MDLNVLAVLVLLIWAVVASDKSFLNEKVMTIIDISSQLVKVSERITIVNELSKPAISYIYIVDPLRKNNLSYIEAEDDKKHSLYVNRVTTNDSSERFEIFFHNSLSPDMAVTLDINTVFINYLQSYPKNVKQLEKHMVLFTFNVYYYSLYFTALQTLVINAGPIDVNVLEGEPYRLVDSTKDGLKYGPFYDKKSEAVLTTNIHYETNSPFLTVENLERFIQISHWGYLNIRDKISLIHSGPKLIGPFERNDKPDTRIESFLASLPEDAFDIYLKDEIGLISSFRLYYDNPNTVNVHIKPRFILYGGWKIQFEMGYSLPTKTYLSYDKINHNVYNLFSPLVNRLFPNMFIKQAKLNVILPEGAIYQAISPHYEVENSTQKRHCYIIDVACREVVSFEVHNLVDHHSMINFQLTYSFSQMHLLLKPLLLSAFIYTLLLLFLLYIRLTSNTNSTMPVERMRPTVGIIKKNPTVSALNKQESITQIGLPTRKEVQPKKKLSKSKMKSRKH